MNTTGREPEQLDDLDDLDLQTSVRRGAHRARPRPLTSLMPVLLVAMAVVAVSFGAVTLLDGTPARRSAPGPADVGTSSPTGSATSPTTDPATDGASDGATDSATDPETTTEPEAPVDPAAQLVVLNGTSRSGLAAGASERLREEGWTVVSTDNLRDDDPPEATTVYYGSDELRSTAQAVAEDVGDAQVEQSSIFPADVTVVLGEDYDA